MASLGITCFDRIGTCLALRDFIGTQMIPEAIMGIKTITIIALGFRCLIHQLLDGLLGSLPDQLEAQITAGEAIEEGDDEDLFIYPRERSIIQKQHIKKG
jgi:hypothetical protein